MRLLSRLLIALATPLSLTACSTVGSEPVAPHVVAPPRVMLVDYSRAIQTALAGEFLASPPGGAMRAAVVDYGQLRRAVCAAEGWRQIACKHIRNGGAQ